MSDIERWTLRGQGTVYGDGIIKAHRDTIVVGRRLEPMENVEVVRAEAYRDALALACRWLALEGLLRDGTTADVALARMVEAMGDPATAGGQ